MVKGVSRRAVVVRPDDSMLFEEAVFFVRDYTAPKEKIMHEACRIAKKYQKKPERKVNDRWAKVARQALVFMLGAALASACWVGLFLLC